jgi:DNA primase
MASSDAKEEVRSRIDLAALIGEYVPLRRAGSRMIARCPFHNEKTPSLSVDTERGLFHCFGCKASGDVFSFYERIENLSFVDALRALAERAGVELEHDTPPEAKAERARQRGLIERLYEANEVACKFFTAALDEDHVASRIAQEEVLRRRPRRLLGDDLTLANNAIVTFRVGYAPPTWQALTDALREAGISPGDAELAGLIRQRRGGSGYYDVFRHRLMFPVIDARGRVIAFSGRALAATGLDLPEGVVPAESGKYINTAETPIYKKGETLFGLHAAKEAIREHQEAVLVEGNFDVVSMHANGFVTGSGHSQVGKDFAIRRKNRVSVPAIVFIG